MSEVRSMSTNTYDEASLTKKYLSKWIKTLMEYGVKYDDDFFEYLAVIFGGPRKILSFLLNSIKEYNSKKLGKQVSHSKLKTLETASSRTYSEEIEDILDDYPNLQKHIIDALHKELDKNISSEVALTGNKAVLDPVKKLFGLPDTAIELIYLAYLNDQYNSVEELLSRLEIFRKENSELLAKVLEIDEAKCKAIRANLERLGLIRYRHGTIEILKYIDEFLNGESIESLQRILCSPLPKSDIPLADFSISQTDIDHATRLLRSRSKLPCQILLYGKPGTGKSTLVRSLATTLGVKAFNVICRNDDSAEDRRASLLACLHLCKSYPGSFVVVDEAEVLLRTDGFDSDNGTSKAFLNQLMEEKGTKIVWVVNDISHISQAVRRRFSYSIQFKELSHEKQMQIWKKIIEKNKVSNRISEDTIGDFVKSYPVPISCIDASIKQAKAISRSKDFIPCIARYLQSYSTLANDGVKPKSVYYDVDNYLADGISISIDFENMIGRLKKIDGYLKNTENVRPGVGCILFYGVSGSGKSELSKYIAHVLDRPYIIKKASSLLSPYVGETEIKINKAFEEAEDQQAVLVIDECDSFLATRQGASQSWEVTMVNEFLTSLEQCRTFCICTTNFRNNLDEALSRRFSVKVEFKYASPKNLAVLYNNILAPLAKDATPSWVLDSLYSHKSLCAGDFNNVRNQLWLEDGITHQHLLDALIREEKLKLEKESKRLGFN